MTIAAGDASATLSVATADDDMDEPHGTVHAALTADAAYAIDASAAAAAVTVRDNEIVACERGTAVPDPDAKPGLVADCKILLAARDTLRGTARLNWSASQGIGQWPGVTVRGQRVVGIELSNTRLNGAIPPALGGLSALTHLQLGDNSLTGPIPPELGNLSRLRLLSLVSNDLTGEIPAALGRLTGLTHLVMHQNALTGEIPWQMGNLSALQFVFLDYGHSHCLPREWRTLSSRPGFLASNFGELDLPFCPPPPCASETTIPGYATKPDLVYDCGVLLDIKDALRGTGRLNWDASRALSTWDGITIAGSPQRVTVLALPSRRLTGAIPPRLGRLDGLTNLSLEWNKLRGAIPAELQRLTALQYLSLYRNRLSGPVPAFLGGLTELRTLTLSDNYLAGAIPAELGNLPHLQGLFLYNNRLTGAIPAGVGRSQRPDRRLPVREHAHGLPAARAGAGGAQRPGAAQPGSLPVAIQDPDLRRPRHDGQRHGRRRLRLPHRPRRPHHAGHHLRGAARRQHHRPRDPPVRQRRHVAGGFLRPGGGGRPDGMASGRRLLRALHDHRRQGRSRPAIPRASCWPWNGEPTPSPAAAAPWCRARPLTCAGRRPTSTGRTSLRPSGTAPSTCGRLTGPGRGRQVRFRRGWGRPRARRARARRMIPGHRRIRPWCARTRSGATPICRPSGASA